VKIGERFPFDLYINVSTAIGILPLFEAKNCYTALVITDISGFLG